MPTPTPTDPNQVIEEIKALLIKHNVAGLVFVQSPDRLAFLQHFCPPWSCCTAQQTAKGLELRVTSNDEIYPDKAERQKVLENTAGMFFAFREQCFRSMQQMHAMCNHLNAQLQVTHMENFEQPGTDQGKN